MNFTTAAIINWHGKAARAMYIVDKVGVRGQLMAKELEVKNLKRKEMERQSLKLYNTKSKVMVLRVRIA
jgi:hypothetical protein